MFKPISLTRRIATALSLFIAVFTLQIHAQPHQLEYLDRGLVVVKASESEVYLSWRLLVNDDEEVQFNVYRSENGEPAARLNSDPIASTTDFIDASADLTASNRYFVRPVVNGVELGASEDVEIAEDAPVQQYLSIPMQVPEGGTTPDGVNYVYSANDLSVGDLDGDGRYEVVVKWYPSNAKDPAQSGYTGNAILDAYTLEGELLWRIDLGVNIRSGAHYTQFVVYDFDGDGISELACRTQEGSRDASGAYVADASKWFGERPAVIDHSADYRNGSGYVMQGPEFLTIFDGSTGVELASTLYEPQRVPDTFYPSSDQVGAIWGDGYGNRVDRFLATPAYLDGVRPSLVVTRGYYTGRNGVPGRTTLAAYDWRDGVLSKRWVFDTLDNEENDSYRGQGAHSLTVGDVDFDGKDEIIYGACAIDDDGSGLYNTGIGHGDALHLSDMDPDRPGMEVWMPHESPSSYGEYGSELHDAATGEILFGVSGSNSDVGRGVAADIDPRFRGYETWASRGGMHTVKGEPVEVAQLPSMNFLVWWDGDPLRELLDGTSITKWNWETTRRDPLFSPEGVVSNNSTKANPGLSADLFGDWREEVIWRSTDSSELRIYTTIVPASMRLVTLMHDRQYRQAIAWQNSGYNQPPHTSFYLGDGMSEPVRPQFFLNKRNLAPEVSLVLPEEGSVFEEGDVASLVAEARDEDGAVGDVSFYENSKFLGMDISDPYTALWDAVAGGSYELRAVATDDAGGQSVSLPVTVTVGFTESYGEELANVGRTPVASDVEGYHGEGYLEFGRPSHFAEFRELDGGLVDGVKTLRIRYSTGRPGLRPVVLTVNGNAQLLRLPSTGSWTNWQEFEIKVPLLAGPVNQVRLQARGGQSFIDGISVAGVVRNQLPVARILSPKDGVIFPEGVDIEIRTEAKDVGGSIASVSFYVGESLVGIDESAPYSLIWQNVGEGLYELTASATDDLGGETVSAPVNIMVNNPPSVAIVSPESGTYIPYDEPVKITADADDGVGTIASVALYADDALVGIDEEVPYEWDWSSDVEGPHSLFATATDNRGVATESLPVGVVVSPDGYTVTYQAEDADAGGDIYIEDGNEGFNGTGYVNFGSSGGMLLFENVDGGSGSLALIRVRFALGAAESRLGRLTINGQSQDIDFPSTGGWTTYRTLDLPFPLDAGKSNEVLFESIGNDLANIDEITILGLQSDADQTHHAENAYQENVSVENSNAGFGGSAYINFPQDGGVLEFRDLDGGIGGVVTLKFRYALGASGERTGRLSVNGVEQLLSFPSTGGWTRYDTLELQVSLLSGPANTIRLESIGNDLGNVDEIVLSGFVPNEVPVVTLLTPKDEEKEVARIFVVGDSTVATYGSGAYPQTGWGQVLQHFISQSEFVVVNRAIGGRSSRNFIEQGRWDSVKAELGAGDYVFVQFGHNDRDWTKEERYTPVDAYRGYIAQYVNEARELGAIPVLVTPMVMNAWRDGALRNVFTESGNDYAGAMKEVAAELGADVIDLNAMSHAFFSLHSYDYNSRFFFNTYPAGEYPNFPDGLSDGTHFQRMGANYMAKFIARSIREQGGDPELAPLADALAAQYPVAIKANIASAGSVTLSTEMPEGVEMTLKAIPADDNTFVGWKTGENSEVEAANIHQFLIGREEFSFIAYFNNDEEVGPPVPGGKIGAGANAGGSWKLGDEMLFTAEAYDPDGSIERVEYFARDARVKIGESTEPPYAFTWSVEGGAYEVWAEAVDRYGARGVSEPYSIEIEFDNELPTVDLLSPVGRTFVDAGVDVLVQAAASDSDGTVQRVEFYVDGAYWGSDETAPYELTVPGFEPGRHEVSVRSVDNFGEASPFATADLRVFFPEGGELLQEAEDGVIAGNPVVTVDAEASGGSSVEMIGGSGGDWIDFNFKVTVGGFYKIRTLVKAIDGNHDSMFITIDGDTSTTHTWDTARSSTYIEDYVKNRRGEDPVVVLLNAGPHTVRFAYRENLFLDQVELVLEKEFDGDEVPELSVSFSAPSEEDTFDPGDFVQVSVDASSTASAISAVRIYLNDALLEEDTEAPYEASIASVEAGLHVLGAQAVDEYGFESDLVTRSLRAAILPTGGLVQEAENGELVGNAPVFEDADASGGKSVELPAGDFPATYAAGNYVELRFPISDPGEYHIRVFVKAIGVQNDSMYVSVDGASAGEILFDTVSGSGYLEDLVSHRGGADPVVLNLTEGVHVIRFGAREGLFLDKVELVPLAAATHTIYTIGDSTVADYSAGYYPQTGWGQVLGEFFDPEVEVRNFAIGGTSSKSYYENHWASVRDRLNSGDYVFIQFGINDRANDPDRKTDYTAFQSYLTRFAEETLARGAYPVLVTTVRRNAWNGDWNGGDPATLYDSYHEHPVATRDLAATLGLPLIDLDQTAGALMESLGSVYTGPFMYMNLEADEYPVGARSDDVHFQEMGAIEMARLVVEGIQSLDADPMVGPLIEWIDPMYEVAVSTPDSSLGIVTRTASYPEGVTVTLKGVPAEGYQFKHWEDTAGDVVSTDRLFQFAMGSEALSYVGIFEEYTGPEPDPVTGIVSGATYRLTNLGSGLFLETSGRSVFQGGETGGVEQAFVLTRLENGNYTITAQANSENVDAYNNNQVGTWVAAPANMNQNWIFTHADGVYRIESVSRGARVLGVDGDSADDGANVGWSVDGSGDFQRWSLDLVE